MLASAALGAADPAMVVLRTDSLEALPAEHPAFGKSAGTGGATAYVCRHHVCELPRRLACCAADPPARAQRLSLTGCPAYFGSVDSTSSWFR